MNRLTTRRYVFEFYYICFILVCLLQFTCGVADSVPETELCFSDEDSINAGNAKRAFALITDGKYPKHSVLFLEEHPIQSDGTVALPPVASKVAVALTTALVNSGSSVVTIDMAAKWTPEDLRLHLFREVKLAQSKLKATDARQNRPPLVIVQLNNLEGVIDMSILNVFHDAFGTPDRMQSHGEIKVSFEHVRFVGVVQVDKCVKNSRIAPETTDKTNAEGSDTSTDVRDRLGFDTSVWRQFARGAGARKWEAVLERECFAHDRVDFSPKALLRRVGDAILFDPATAGNQDIKYAYKEGSPCKLGKYAERKPGQKVQSDDGDVNLQYKLIMSDVIRRLEKVEPLEVVVTVLAWVVLIFAYRRMSKGDEEAEDDGSGWFGDWWSSWREKAADIAESATGKAADIADSAKDLVRKDSDDIS